jgi:hypothetical protein
MHDTIKILRLKDGEDIITAYRIDEKSNVVVMDNPMTIFFKRMGMGKSIVMMNPWLPLEIVEQNIAKIYADEIMTIIEPKQSLVQYYLQSVKESKEMVEMNSKMIDEALLNMADDKESDEEEMLQAVKESKRNLLH